MNSTASFGYIFGMEMDLKLNFMKFSMRSFRGLLVSLFVQGREIARSIVCLRMLYGILRDLYCYTKPDYCVLCAAWIWPIDDKKISWNRISIKP